MKWWSREIISHYRSENVLLKAYDTMSISSSKMMVNQFLVQTGLIIAVIFLFYFYPDGFLHLAFILSILKSHLSLWTCSSGSVSIFVGCLVTFCQKKVPEWFFIFQRTKTLKIHTKSPSKLLYMVLYFNDCLDQAHGLFS